MTITQVAKLVLLQNEARECNKETSGLNTEVGHLMACSSALQVAQLIFVT